MITIRDSKGNQKMQVIENGSHQRKYELMVTDEVSLKFTSKEDISLNIGDYIDISEGRFYIIAEHQPTRNDTNGMYDYSPVFYDEIFLWKNKVLKYSPIGGGAEASFSLTDSIGSHTRILLDNIKSLGYDYSIEIDETVDDKHIELQYSNTSVYDAMIQIAQGFECDCWKDGNVIYFGSCYKKDVSTWTYEEEIASLKPVRSKGGYASMIYPFGSSENLPASYKKALNLKVVNVNGDNIKLNKAVTADMFGGERVYQPTETITIGNNLQYRLNGLYESGAIGELALQPSNYRVDLSNVKVYVDFVKDTQSGTQTGRYTNATVDLIVYANLSTGRQIISKTLLECTNESFISTALSGLSSVYITTNKLLKSISYSIEVKTDSTASDGYVLFSITNSSVSFQNQNYKLIALTNIGTVELNSEYKPLEETAGWVKVLGSVPVIDTPIKFEHEYSYNIPLGWYEDTNIGSVKTGVVQTNLSLPTIDGEREEDGFVITSDYIRIASVEPKYSVDKVVVFEQIKPNFTITDYRVESEEQTKKYENAEATYKFIQYMIDAPIMEGFSNKCILTSLGIQFQSGKLNGMSFEAAWQDNRLYIIPNTNYGRELPDYDLYPEDDDAFILTGIDVSFFSESSIAQAEQELVETTKEYLSKMFNEGLSYEVKVRPIYAKDNIKTIGSLIALPKSSEPVKIYGYTYPLAKPYSNYVYQLGNSAKYSALGSLQEYVAKSLNIPTIKPTPQKGVNTGDFVSKTKDETIKGHITIENSLDVLEDINVDNLNAKGGVSAKGISDFGLTDNTNKGSDVSVTPLITGGQAIADIYVDGEKSTIYAPIGGNTDIEVLRDEQLDGIAESVKQVASAYAVRKIRDIINIDDIEVFSEDKDYGRGNLVRRGDRLYRFFYNHSKGAWASGDVEPVNITTLSTPLSITDNDLTNILK